MEARQLAAKGEYDAAIGVLNTLARQYPELKGSIAAEVRDFEDRKKKAAADEKARQEAAARAKEEQAAADEEARLAEEARQEALLEISAAIDAEDFDRAATLLDADPDLAASTEGATLRKRLDAAIENAKPSVNVGDLVTPGMGGVRAPRVKSKVEPKFPPIARRQRVSGNVVVEALVDENGQVIDTRIKSVDSNPSGNWGFESAAEKAARSCTFEPATREGVRVKMWIAIPFTFK